MNRTNISWALSNRYSIFNSFGISFFQSLCLLKKSYKIRFLRSDKQNQRKYSRIAFIFGVIYCFRFTADFNRICFCVSKLLSKKLASILFHLARKNKKVQFQKLAILLIGGISTMTMELIKDTKRFFLKWGRTIYFLKISYFDVGSNALD